MICGTYFAFPNVQYVINPNALGNFTAAGTVFGLSSSIGNQIYSIRYKRGALRMQENM